MAQAMKTAAGVMPLAKEIAEVCFTNGIFLNGCGCCGVLTYKGVDFDQFTIDPDGTVVGSALIRVPGEDRMDRVRFSFKMET